MKRMSLASATGKTTGRIGFVGVAPSTTEQSTHSSAMRRECIFLCVYNPTALLPLEARFHHGYQSAFSVTAGKCDCRESPRCLL